MGGMGGNYRGNEPQIDPEELKDDIDAIEKLLERVKVRDCSLAGSACEVLKFSGGVEN